MAEGAATSVGCLPPLLGGAAPDVRSAWNRNAALGRRRSRLPLLSSGPCTSAADSISAAVAATAASVGAAVAATAASVGAAVAATAASVGAAGSTAGTSGVGDGCARALTWLRVRGRVRARVRVGLGLGLGLGL